MSFASVSHRGSQGCSPSFIPLLRLPADDGATNGSAGREGPREGASFGRWDLLLPSWFIVR